MRRAEERAGLTKGDQGDYGTCGGNAEKKDCTSGTKKGCGPCGDGKKKDCESEKKKDACGEKKGCGPCGDGKKKDRFPCGDGGGRNKGKQFNDDDDDDDSVTTPLLSAPVTTETRTVTFAVSGITCSDCSQLVERKLRKKQGILSVQVSAVTGKTVVTYDTTALGEVIIQKEIESLGHEAELVAPSSLSRVDFEIVGLALAEDIKRIESRLSSMPGVVAVSADPETHSVAIDYQHLVTGARTLMEEIEGLGYSPTLRTSTLPALSGGRSQTQQEIARLRRCFWVSTIFGLPVLLIAFVAPYVPYVSDAFEDRISGFTRAVLVNWMLATPIQFYVGYPLYLSAYRALVYGRTANMDSLVVLSTTTAYVYSVVSVAITLIDSNYETEFFFETSAILLMLIMLGRYMEALAKGKPPFSCA